MEHQLSAAQSLGLVSVGLGLLEMLEVLEVFKVLEGLEVLDLSLA